MTAYLLAWAALAAVQPTDAAAQTRASLPTRPNSAEEEEEVEIIVQATRSRPPRPGRADPRRGDHARGDRGKSADAARATSPCWSARPAACACRSPRPRSAPPTSACRAWTGATPNCSPTACRSTAARPRRSGCCRSRPTDLGRVEVIKGAASALYGPSALGGVINLVSRRPGDEPEAEVLAQRHHARRARTPRLTSRRPSPSGLGGSISGGLHRQSRHGPRRRRLDRHRRLRPLVRAPALVLGRRQWRQAVRHRSARWPRIAAAARCPAAPSPTAAEYRQEQSTDRFDAGLVAEAPGRRPRHGQRARLGHDPEAPSTASARCIENDRHGTLFAETSLAGGSKRTPWIAGLAFQGDDYRNRRPSRVRLQLHRAGASSARSSMRSSDELTLAGSARADFHSEYGTQLSPRLSMLYRPGPWTISASLGRGFYAPTPFVEEIEAAGPVAARAARRPRSRDRADRVGRRRLHARPDRSEHHPVRRQHRQRDPDRPGA